MTLRDCRGWSDEISLSSDAKISITSKKSNIGLCLQTGNMGRFYADLIKLEFLHKQGVIAAGIYIIPCRCVTDGALFRVFASPIRLHAWRFKALPAAAVWPNFDDRPACCMGLADSGIISPMK
jgi:hypothetical protein